MKVRIKIVKSEYFFLNELGLPIEVEAEHPGLDYFQVDIEELKRLGATGMPNSSTITFLNTPEHDEVEVLEEIHEQEKSAIYLHTYQHASGLNQKTRVNVYDSSEKAEAQRTLLGGTVKKYVEA